MRRHGRWSWRHLGGREDDNTRETRVEAERIVATLVAAGLSADDLRIVPVPRDVACTYAARAGREA